MEEGGPTITELLACCDEHEEDIHTLEVSVPRGGMTLLVEGLAEGEPYVVLRARDVGVLEAIQALVSALRRFGGLTASEGAFQAWVEIERWRRGHPELLTEAPPRPSRLSTLSTGRLRPPAVTGI